MQGNQFSRASTVCNGEVVELGFGEQETMSSFALDGRQETELSIASFARRLRDDYARVTRSRSLLSK